MSISRLFHNHQGIAPIFIVVGILILLFGGAGLVAYSQNRSSGTSENDQTAVEDSASPTATSSGSSTKATAKPSTKASSSPTSSPKPGATSTGGSASATYDLTSATGSIKVTIKASSGSLVGDQIVELKSIGGAKVLVGKSTDTDTRIAKQGNPTVDFATVPPGKYKVKVRYKDQWTGEHDVTVQSAKQSTVEVSVTGDSAAATSSPANNPKPTCFNPTAFPSSSGSAPYQVTLSPGGNAGSAGSINGYQWDFDGNGSWDTGISGDAQLYTYSNAGSYTVKMRVQASNGEYSEVCQLSITVN